MTEHRRLALDRLRIAVRAKLSSKAAAQAAIAQVRAILDLADAVREQTTTMERLWREDRNR
jgi:hypothetical protein